MLHKNMKNENLRRHCYAVGFALAGIYDYLKSEGKLDKTTPKREVWEILGILHDSDYELTKDDWSKHTLLTLKWLAEESVDKNGPLYKAIESHNNKLTKLREPKTQMEWALECVDELTGLIVACTLVLPSKKMEDLKLKSVGKRFKEKAFARAVDREQIAQCEEKLGITLDKYIEITCKSMKNNADRLGL